MNNKIRSLKQIIIAPDIAFSGLVAVIIYYLIPEQVSNSFCKDIYSIGISVLSIVFSVYFAALVFIMSAEDEAFIGFLESKGRYTNIILLFRFSLIVLFSALIFSIIAYVTTLVFSEIGAKTQPKGIISVFTFLFLYGLLAALSVTLDSIRYALSRLKFKKRVKEISSDTRSHETD